ncbi:MAG: HlyD family efflux transporter periplasmic adaptor subunit [Rhodobacteraceae bacterium]|nr:HlyD family efflux transporter periplasmic adaptor subunit [Paracoccaceae bacterium]
MASLLCTLPLIGALLADCAPPPPLATGYVEGEYVLIAPITNVRIDSLSVRRGDRVVKDQQLVTLEKRDAEIALAGADAGLARLESQLADLQQGRRPAEIAVIEAALSSARAQLVEAEREASRQQDLFARRVSTQAQLDAANTAVLVASAGVTEGEANLAVARLPARPDQIAAAEAAVAEARAQLSAAQWQLDKRILSAPNNGTVTEILRNQGELAGPQAPVLEMLPEGAVKLRLYVPEIAISSIRPGSILTVNCDGCASGTEATVTYVSDSPEFTPPVIYSLENRQKLVFLIEAEPNSDAHILKPGQIVDVDLKKDGS